MHTIQMTSSTGSAEWGRMSGCRDQLYSHAHDMCEPRITSTTDVVLARLSSRSAVLQSVIATSEDGFDGA